MGKYYTPPKKRIKELQNVIDTCQSWIKSIKDAEGTDQEKEIMLNFENVDFFEILAETS